MVTAQEPPQEEQPAGIRYLALGDSYTIGESVRKKKRWPVQLAKLLGKQGIAVQEPHIVAKTGWTTDELAQAIEDEDLDQDYDFVTLLIGVNNQYRGRPVDQYREEFEELLKLAIEFAQGNPHRVIVVSIPDYGLTPFIAEKPDRDPAQIAQELDAYNAAAKSITEQLDAGWVDITPASREHGAKKKMLAEDGLHPSGRMYSLWAEAALPLAVEHLSDHESAAK